MSQPRFNCEETMGKDAPRYQNYDNRQAYCSTVLKSFKFAAN